MGEPLRVFEPPGASVLVLRVLAPPPPALAEVLGAGLPVEPNRAVGEAPRLLWLAPGEWAILGAPDGLAPRIEVACAGTVHHLADLMQGWASFRVDGAGDAPRDLLARGCSLDLHPRVFGPDACARTLLAQVPVLIERAGDGFVVHVDRSLAQHLRRWFAVSHPHGAIR